jgi:hypothetical protein
MGKSVLFVGIDPPTIDFSDSAYAPFAHLNAEKVQAGLDNDVAELNRRSYRAELCLAAVEDLPAAVRNWLGKKSYDCILVGAGVRTIAKNFVIFEKTINVIHELAPRSRICFNSKPDDSAEAVERVLA